jgi:hypothetical protein
MTIGHLKTPEEETFYQIVYEEWELLSEGARTVVRQAMDVAHKEYLIDGRIYMPEEYEDDMKAMRRTAAELTEDDCEGLTKIWRSALAAAASVDPYDYETLVGWREYRADLHGYYRMVSSKVEEVEWEKRLAEFRKKEFSVHNDDEEEASNASSASRKETATYIRASNNPALVAGDDEMNV